MSLALYRKYRPQTFQEVIGQNHIKTTLQSELASGKIAHAYLFSGPRGLGKTTTARLLAKAVNCLERKEGSHEPCNQCAACQEVMANKSLDVLEIDAASHTGVDNVRENIIANARFTPTNRRYKVFIIDEVHMLSPAAFNALLKTLEEPPSHAIFILATTEIHKVPETIISRCQRFDFRRVTLNDLVSRLADVASQEKKKVDAEVLASIARLAQGSVRDAESLLGQILVLGEKTISQQQAELVLPRSQFNLVFELVADLLKPDAAAALLLINRLVQEGVTLSQFTSDLIEILRKLLLIKIGRQLDEFTLSLSDDLQRQLNDLSQLVQVAQLVRMIELFVAAQRELKVAEISQLPLELAVVEICQNKTETNDSDFPSRGQLANQVASLAKPKKALKSTVIKTQTIEPEPQKTISVNRVKITLEQIKEKWEEVLAVLKNYNQSLASTLKHHRPTAIKENGIIEISFKYKFYQQRINESKNRQILEKTLEDIFKIPLRVETVLVKRLPQESTEVAEADKKTNLPPQQSLESIVQTFGGQLVD